MNDKPIIKDDKEEVRPSALQETLEQKEEVKTVPIIDNKAQIEEVKPKIDEEYSISINQEHGMGVDIFKIPDPNPAYEYRWLNTKAQTFGQRTGNMLHFGGGWQVCSKEHILKIGFKEADLAADGLMRLNELVLGFMPQQLYSEKVKVKQHKANEPVDRVKKLIQKGDPNAEGTRPHETMRGIQTKDELKGNWKD